MPTTKTRAEIRLNPDDRSRLLTVENYIRGNMPHTRPITAADCFRYSLYVTAALIRDEDNILASINQETSNGQ